MYGPVEGRRHDCFLLRQSDLQNRIHDMDPNGKYLLYGDGGYRCGSHIVGPHLGAYLTKQQENFNLIMSRLRIVVEWGFKEIISIFAHFNYKNLQRALVSPVANFYKCAVILTNCRGCLRGGNQISHIFNIWV